MQIRSTRQKGYKGKTKVSMSEEDNREENATSV